MRISINLVVAVACAALLAACTSEQLYNTGQGWRRESCDKLADREQRDRCLKEADRPYDAYKKEADKTAAP